MIVYLQLSTNGMLSYVIFCQMISVYRMFLKYVLELPTIQLLTGYNIEFSIEFFLLNIILRKSELLPLTAVLFVMICLKPYNMFLQIARKYNLYGMHLVYLYMRNATKMLVLMFVMYYLVFIPLIGRTEF